VRSSVATRAPALAATSRQTKKSRKARCPLRYRAFVCSGVMPVLRTARSGNSTTPTCRSQHHSRRERRWIQAQLPFGRFPWLADFLRRVALLLVRFDITEDNTPSKTCGIEQGFDKIHP
jgi:hypothetical protein